MHPGIRVSRQCTTVLEAVCSSPGRSKSVRVQCYLAVTNITALIVSVERTEETVPTAPVLESTVSPKETIEKMRGWRGEWGRACRAATHGEPMVFTQPMGSDA